MTSEPETGSDTKQNKRSKPGGDYGYTLAICTVNGAGSSDR